MLDVVQQYYWGNEKVIDITVEDPSDDFVRLRDFVDCTNCATLDAFAPHNLHKGYSAAMVKECNQKFKICRRQSRRVYEILRMRAVENHFLRIVERLPAAVIANGSSSNGTH